MLSVVFYNRDYTSRTPLPVQPAVESYTWNMQGGPDKAKLTAPMHANGWDLMKLLRCPVEIYGGDGRLNWYGYVNKVTIPHGVQRIGQGLDLLYNSVTFEYNGGTTAAATNAVSIADYGTKEYKLFDSNATAAEGTQAANMWLAEHEYAHPEVEFSGGAEDIQIECYGWWQSLDWKYYTSTDTTNIENTTQISTIATSVGQFLNGTIIEHIAGITSSAERDGDRTGLSYISALLNAGTTDTRPLLAYVDSKRNLHVYERDVEPDENTASYMLAQDGSLETGLGQIVPPEHCICAKWVRVKDVPISGKSTVAMRPFFIESSEYKVKDGKTIYRPANAYEQERLAKFVQDVANNGGDSYTGYTDYPAPPAPATSMYRVIKAYDDTGAEIYSSASGLSVTRTDFSWTSHYVEYTFTAPSAGLYMMGGSVTYQGTTGNDWANVTLFDLFDNAAGLDPQSISFVVTGTAQATCTAADYLDATQAIRIYMSWSGSTAPPYCHSLWVVKLS